jgi:hypothetical protein
MANKPKILVHGSIITTKSLVISLTSEILNKLFYLYKSNYRPTSSTTSGSSLSTTYTLKLCEQLQFKGEVY